MDPVTHTLVGAVTAQGFFRKKIGPEAVPVLCWASNLPDIDTLVLLTRDPAAITLRRSFGHSVFLFPLWSLALAWLFSRLYPKQRLATLFLLCLLGCALHVFFDLVNSFGVLALWPFSNERPELSIIFIVDLALLGLLAAPFAAARFSAFRGKLEGACRASAALVGIYVIFCAGARLQAEVLLRRHSGGFAPEFSYVFPEPLGPHRWRGVLRAGDEYRVYLINALTNRVTLAALTRTDINRPAVESVRRSSPLARRLESFFKAPVWSVAPDDGSGALVQVYDLRFRPLVWPRAPAFKYAFRVKTDGAVQELGRTR